MPPRLPRAVQRRRRVVHRITKPRKAEAKSPFGSNSEILNDNETGDIDEVLSR